MDPADRGHVDAQCFDYYCTTISNNSGLSATAAWRAVVATSVPRLQQAVYSNVPLRLTGLPMGRR